MLEWRNGRRCGLKIRWRVTSVWVRLPSLAPIKNKETSINKYGVEVRGDSFIKEQQSLGRSGVERLVHNEIDNKKRGL